MSKKEKKYEVWCAKTLDDINTANYERSKPVPLDEAFSTAKKFLEKGYIEIRIHPF